MNLFSKNVSGSAANSWCHGIVSYSARLLKTPALESEWKMEILDLGLQRLQIAAPVTKGFDQFCGSSYKFGRKSRDSE